MKKLRSYALALGLCVTSVGALSSNDLTDDGIIQMKKIGDAISSVSTDAYQHISTSLNSTFRSSETRLKGTHSANAGQEDQNMLGTLVVVAFIAGFSIIRRLD